MTSDGPVVDSCPNCGAPLKLDNAGDCIWCHAHVHVSAMPVVPRGVLDAELAARVLWGNLLDGDPGDIELLQPVSNLLIFLSTTGQEAPVQDFLSHWEHKEAVGALLQAVRAGGTRVTLSAKAAQGFSEFSDHSSLYTTEDWWAIALATDLLALVAGLPGVDPMQAVDSTRQAHDVRDTYRKHLAKATPPGGEDAGRLLTLREAVPRSDASGGPGAAEEESPRHHLFHRHQER
jgi:hypothetical protein